MKLLARFAVLCLLAAPVCVAQDQTPETQDQTTQNAAPPSAQQTPEHKIDPAKEADIRRLLDLVGTAALVHQMVDRMEQSMKPVLSRSLPPGDYRDRLIALFFEKFNSKFSDQQVVDLAIARYDENFSDDEIKQMIAFDQTPIGQKVIKVLPKLTAELQDDGGKLGREVGQQSMIEVLQEHPELKQALQEAAAQKPSGPNQ